METQDNNNIQPEDLGGTTNLSLDQLKDEGGIYNPSEDNPDQLTNRDDLHEIQAGDDLDEPDTDAYESVTSEETLGVDETEDNQSANDADGNGEPVNPTELNS